MERKKIIELIKLDVLGCLNEKNREELQSQRLTAEEFPLRELADYQFVVALLPTVLEIRTPATELKDKTAMKLYNLREEIKAKIEAKKALETVAEPVEVKLEQAENEEFGELIEVKEKVVVEEEVAVGVGEEIQLGGFNSAIPKDDPFKVISSHKEKRTPDNFLQEVREAVESIVPKQQPDKEMIEKITRDYINSQLKREIESMNQSLKQSRMLSYIFFAVTLILIAVLFFIK
ncbi:MAG: hypothetical protein IPM14_02810 [bacterium]|nr:hypothetical protein [bacterium]